MITALALLSVLAFQDPTEIGGPARVCLPRSQFALTADEVIQSVSASLHGVALTISGSSGPYRISENEIVRTPADLGVLIRRGDGIALYRANNGRGYSFTVADPERGGERLMVMLDGAPLSGAAGDAAIYDRVTIGAPPSEGCSVRYGYGSSHVGP